MIVMMQLLASSTKRYLNAPYAHLEWLEQISIHMKVLKSISTTAALRCALRAIVNDSERYVAMSRYIM